MRHTRWNAPKTNNDITSMSTPYCVQQHYLCLRVKRVHKGIFRKDKIERDLLMHFSFFKVYGVQSKIITKISNVRTVINNRKS